MLFGTRRTASVRGRRLADRQLGDAMTDGPTRRLADAEDRRAHERVLRAYHEALQSTARAACWEECPGHRRHQPRPLMTVAAHRARREVLPDVQAPVQRVRLRDDAHHALGLRGVRHHVHARHEPGSEQLWNESWYFDAIAEDGSFGVYTRLGLYPNLGVSWVTAFACGPGRPTVALVDFAVAGAGRDLAVSGEGLHATHVCERARRAPRAEGSRAVPRRRRWAAARRQGRARRARPTCCGDGG